MDEDWFVEVFRLAASSLISVSLQLITRVPSQRTLERIMLDSKSRHVFVNVKMFPSIFTSREEDEEQVDCARVSERQDTQQGRVKNSCRTTSVERGSVGDMSAAADVVIAWWMCFFDMRAIYKLSLITWRTKPNPALKEHHSARLVKNIPDRHDKKSEKPKQTNCARVVKGFHIFDFWSQLILFQAQKTVFLHVDIWLRMSVRNSSF